MIKFNFFKKNRKLSNDEISILEECGWSRWTKGRYDRLYFNIQNNGALNIKYYKTGNICSSVYYDENISHSMANRLLGIKAYIDVNSGDVAITDYRGALSQEAKMIEQALKESLEIIV